MGRHGIKHTCVCVDCGARGELSKTEAKKDRWDLWLGGARCPGCATKHKPKAPAPFPYELPKHRDFVIVACSQEGCDHMHESSQFYADGEFRPGIHWTKNPELVQRTIDSRARKAIDPKAKLVPLPLCPGWDKAGRVVRIERRDLIPLPPEASP